MPQPNTGSATSQSGNAPTQPAQVQPIPASMNIHQIATFVPTFDGSFPVQDFLQEVRDARDIGAWPDSVTLRVTKSKLTGSVAEIVRNRHDLNCSTSFDDFAEKLVSALNSDRPVSSRLQDLMTCVQHPAESVDAYAARLRNKAKTLTEWDATPETLSLKNRTVAATFVKGLRLELRQLVLPHNPSDFNEAITMARTQELNSSLLPSPAITQSASAVQTGPADSIQQLQNRVASLELAASHQPPQRGSRGRPPFRRNFRQRGNFSSRGRGYSTPPSTHQGYRYPRHDFRSYSTYQPRYQSSHQCYCSGRPHQSQHERHGRDRCRHSSRSHSRDRRDHSSRSHSRDPRDHSSRSYSRDQGDHRSHSRDRRSYSSRSHSRDARGRSFSRSPSHSPDRTRSGRDQTSRPYHPNGQRLRP